jgi:hypothetical protein
MLRQPQRPPRELGRQRRKRRTTTPGQRLKNGLPDTRRDQTSREWRVNIEQQVYDA